MQLSSFATYPGSLGSPICSDTAVCDDALTAVNQMDSVFQNAPSNVQAQFQSSHDSIMSSWSTAYGWGIEAMIPFANNCCTLQTIGQQAFDLMNQIQNAMGQSASPGVQASVAASSFSLPTLLVVGVVAYFALPLILASRK